MAFPSLIGTGAGALLSAYVPTELLRIGLGLVLTLLALVFWNGGLGQGSKIFSGRMAIVLCALSGLAAGLVGTGGAIRGLALASMGVERNTFVALSAAIDFSADFLRMIIYLGNGFMDWSQWFYLPLLALAAFLGARAGKALLAYVNQTQFEKIVAVFIFASGLMMIFQI